MKITVNETKENNTSVNVTIKYNDTLRSEVVDNTINVYDHDEVVLSVIEEADYIAEIINETQIACYINAKEDVTFKSYGSSGEVGEVDTELVKALEGLDC